jgi:hypothetical protein
MGFEEIGWEDVNWINLAQDRDRFKPIVGTLMNIQVPYNARDFLSD